MWVIRGRDLKGGRYASPRKSVDFLINAFGGLGSSLHSRIDFWRSRTTRARARTHRQTDTRANASSASLSLPNPHPFSLLLPDQGVESRAQRRVRDRCSC